MEGPEGGYMHIDYSIPELGKNVGCSVFVDAELVKYWEIISYHDKPLSSLVFEFDRSKCFPCINENIGSFQLFVDCVCRDDIKVSVYFKQDYGPCFMNDSAIRKLEKILGFGFRRVNINKRGMHINNLEGRSNYKNLVIEDEEGDFMLRDGISVRLDGNDPHPVDFYSLLLQYSDAFEHIRRNIKPLIII